MEEKNNDEKSNKQIKTNSSSVNNFIINKIIYMLEHSNENKYKNILSSYYFNNHTIT